MYQCEDKIPDELDPQNQVIIAFLNQVHNAPEERSPVQQEQAIDRVRQRLLGLEQKEYPEQITQPTHILMRPQSGPSKVYPAIVASRTRWPQRLKLLAAIACTLLVIGSTIFAFQRIQQSELAAPSGIKHSQSTATPQSSQQVTATPMSVQEQARNLVTQFHQEVDTWGSAHLYHDSYDGHDYPLDDAYKTGGVELSGFDLTSGMYSALDSQLSHASTTADFGAVITVANNALFSLHMLEANAQDQTPCNRVHQSDTQLLAHDQLTQGQVVVVSLTEQCMRVYQNGALVKSFLVVTGQQGASSLPGIWKIQQRFSGLTLMSSWPQSSPNWSPPIYLNYALRFYPLSYITDSWWRTQYGPGTQFPHADPGTGSTGQITTNGTYGSIQLAEADASWLYQNTSLSTNLVIY